MKTIALLSCLLVANITRAELPDLQPILGQRGEIIYQSDFTAADAKLPEGKLGKREFVNGALRLEERKADHHQAAVNLYEIGDKSGQKSLTEFIMQVDFMNDGATNFQVGFNRRAGLAKKEEDGKTWAVTPHVLTIAFRQPADSAKPHDWLMDDNSVEPSAHLGTQLFTAEPNQWYRLLIEIKGDEVSVQLSNGQTIRGKAKNPNDPKGSPILRCQSDDGKGVFFKDIKVWATKAKD